METITELIKAVKDTYNEIGKTSSQAFQFRKQGEKGYAQSCMVRVRYLHRKLLGLKQQIQSIVKGNVAYITYEVTTKQNLVETRQAILTNMTDKDIYAILDIYCQVGELKLNKVLEIKRISTKLG